MRRQAMDTVNPMDTLLMEFRAGQLTRPEFERKVIAHLVDNPHRFSLKLLHPEDRMDFISFYFPRFRKALENYRNTGHSFDAYIHRSIQFALRDYRKEEQLNHEEELRLWHQSEGSSGTGEANCLVLDMDGPYDHNDTATRIRNPRQVLLLTLKAYRYISPDFAQKVARSLGIEPGKLEQWIHEIRLRRAKIDERIDALQASIQLCYIKKLRYEQQLAITGTEPLAKTKLEWRAAKNLQRLEQLSAKLEKMKKTASNQTLAEVLQIPKGTVDANLFALKQRCKAQHQQWN